LKPGDTFYFADRSIDPHLWIVVSDPTKHKRTVVANTSTKDGGDPSGLPVIEVGQHQGLSQRSFVRLERLRFVDSAAIEQNPGRQLSPSRPLTPTLFSRLRQETVASPRCRREAKEMLNAETPGASTAAAHPSSQSPSASPPTAY
jgi:hypothetical protein